MNFELPKEEKKDLIESGISYLKGKIDEYQNMDEKSVKDRVSFLIEEIGRLKEEKQKKKKQFLGVSDEEKMEAINQMKEITNLRHELKELQNILEIGTQAATDEVLDKLFNAQKELEELENN